MPGRWLWFREQIAFLAVVVGIGAGFLLLLARPQNWRYGIGVIGVFVVAAAVIRLLLPTARVGHLAARSRGVDVVLYVLLGVLILAVDLRLRA